MGSRFPQAQAIPCKAMKTERGGDRREMRGICRGSGCLRFMAQGRGVLIGRMSEQGTHSIRDDGRCVRDLALALGGA
jgi:hypothetical protein